MDQMAKPKGLALRGAVYYSRVIVPKTLILRFGRKQIWKSLGTSDKDEAEALHLKEAAYWKAAFVEAGKPEPRRKSSKPASADAVLTDADAARLSRRFFDRARAKLDNNPVSSADLDDWERARLVEDLQTQLSSLSSWRHPDAHMHVGEAAAQALEGSGVAVGWNTASSERLAEYLRRALIQLHSIELARLLGDYRGQVSDTFFAAAGVGNGSPTSPAAVQPTSPTMQEAIARYLTEELELRLVSDKTAFKHRSLLNHLSDFFGQHTSVGSINRADCNRLRNTLSRLPPNFGKRSGKKQPLEKIADANKTGPTLAWETQNSYLRMADNLFGWMLKERLITDNPASGIGPLRRREAAEMQRLPFNIDELQSIFATPVYTGCVDDELGFARAGTKVIRRSRYWVPLLALFTGMRMGEVLQLTPDHVRLSAQGTHFIVLTRDMMLKTDAAEREIPIHPELERLGFIAWVDEKRRAGAEALFDEVPISKYGYRSDTFTKRFATFLKKVDLPVERRGKLCFHSFRHSFKDALNETGASEEVKDEICGWSRAKKTGRRYGTGLSADRLKSFIDQVTFEIELSHLPCQSSF
jgi:integrase